MRQRLVSFMAFAGPEKDLKVQLHVRSHTVDWFSPFNSLSAY